MLLILSHLRAVEDFNASLKIKGRVEHRLGEVLAETVNHAGSRGQLKGDTVSPQEITKPPEITNKQSSRAQQLARLSWEEIETRIDAESVIQRFARSFVEMGEALKVIRDRRLYRKTHETFEEYCGRRWGISERQSYRFIDASTVAASVESCPMGQLSMNERQARELTYIRDSGGNIDEDAVVEAWGKVVERSEAEGVPITAKLVRAVVRVRVSGRKRKRRNHNK